MTWTLVLIYGMSSATVPGLSKEVCDAKVYQIRDQFKLNGTDEKTAYFITCIGPISANPMEEIRIK